MPLAPAARDPNCLRTLIILRKVLWETRTWKRLAGSTGSSLPPHLLQATGTQILEIECREQPQRFLDLIRAYRSDPEIRSQLKNFRQLSQKPGSVMFIGMGASYCSSFSASVELTTHGRLSFSADAGEWLHYARPVWNDAALSVLLTTSGESAELVKLMETRRRPRNRLDL